MPAQPSAERAPACHVHPATRAAQPTHVRADGALPTWLDGNPNSTWAARGGGARYLLDPINLGQRGIPNQVCRQRGPASTYRQRRCARVLQAGS